MLITVTGIFEWYLEFKNHSNTPPFGKWCPHLTSGYARFMLVEWKDSHLYKRAFKEIEKTDRVLYRNALVYGRVLVRFQW